MAEPFAGRFRIVAELGGGATAEVCVAEDLRLGGTVALKILLPQLAADAAVRERFRREVLAAREIEHPGVVRIHDLVEAGGRLALVMEHLPGGDLRARLDREGPLAPAEVAGLGRALAEALAAAHARGVLHRDVKPANVLFDAAGAPRLGDFGSARLQTLVGLTTSSLVIGTPEYCSPEVLGKGRVDQRSDLFSLGAVLFEALTGQVPFRGATAGAHLFGRTPAPAASSLRPGVPDWLDATLASLLSLDPALRPRTAAAVAEAFASGRLHGETALAQRRRCVACGEPMAPDVPVCLRCGASERRFQHAHKGPWAVVLRRIDEDAERLAALRELLETLSGARGLRLEFIFGDARLYSKAERRRAIRLPVTLISDLDREVADEIAALFRARGATVDVVRTRFSMRWKGAAAGTALGGFLLGFVASSTGIGALVPLGVLIALGSGAFAVGFGAFASGRGRLGKRFMVRLQPAPVALPAGDALVDALAPLARSASPELRAIGEALASESYRLARRLASADAAERALLEPVAARLRELAPGLGRIADEITELDRALVRTTEGALYHELQAVERRLEHAGADAAPPLIEAKRELLGVLGATSELERRRARLVGALLAVVEDVSRWRRDPGAAGGADQALEEAMRELGV